MKMEVKHSSLLTSILNQLLDAVCVVSEQGHFVYVSPGCERVFGYTPAEMIGREMITLVAPEDRERTLAEAANVMSGRPWVGFENRYVHKNGHLVDVMWSAKWSETERVRIAVARDVTVRKRALSMQAAVYAIAQLVIGADDLPALYREIHQIIGTLLPATAFTVAIQSGKGGALVFPYPLANHDTAAMGLSAIFDQVLTSGEPLLLNEPEQLSDAAAHADGRRLTSWLGVPLSAERGTFGVLALGSYEGGVSYDKQDLELLQFVSTQVASAIEYKTMQEQLKRMALYDELTQLPNRVLLAERIGNAIARAQREHSPFSLLFLDLNGFKAINDCYGHAAGDRLLQEVARRLSAGVRQMDMVARLSGDEFVVLLDNTNAVMAQGVADKLAAQISMPVAMEGDTSSITVIASVGVASYPDDGLNELQLLTCADLRMYAAKRHGAKRASLSYSANQE
ncbi:diguanylate cyclase domain-containing protein [Chitinibacter sp. S2-10]|uniref:diguanylate cyclase domain-containing protein n=1 Tax=Chitinibacter sp. S2-10 TaxID=3373597 RepID=UPI0039776692